MGNDLCEDLARELAYIESSGCLRYIRVDYNMLSKICASQRLQESIKYKIRESLLEAKRSSEICVKIQETPEPLREELYGQIYAGIKRMIDHLEDGERIARETLTPMRRAMIGFSISLILLDIASLISFSQDLLALAILVAVALFSTLNIALAYVEPKLSTVTALILSLALLVSSMWIGDPAKIYASTAILVIFILLNIVLLLRI
ncbi:MAG: hypothetical protein RQ885_02395 [Desulfurococcales archaeon]|jgi:hypothetical protein|nr:hypothetical protein [Desulfurococcales archaeon]